MSDKKSTKKSKKDNTETVEKKARGATKMCGEGVLMRVEPDGFGMIQMLNADRAAFFTARSSGSFLPQLRRLRRKNITVDFEAVDKGNDVLEITRIIALH